ncbi:MAG: hypothetical protein KDK36_02145 [Leptospiraceae bacterium]|nr:hypothetical protein [Leptospiraceae bacterium]
MSQTIVTQKLIFAADKIINPANILLNEGYYETAQDQLGKAKFNFCAIPIYGKQTKVVSISASLAENYSSTGRSVHPVSQIAIYVSRNKTISFLNKISEEKLIECRLKFDKENILSFEDLSREYKISDSYTPVNIVEFDATLDNKLPYLPRAVRGEPSIVDGMRKFFECSFVDSYIYNHPLIVPSQTDYLLVFPFSTIPIRSSLILGNAGNLSIAIIVTIVLEEIENVVNVWGQE